MDLMTHSSSFLLPTVPADNGPALTYALVLLNQRLPRFTPLLWKHAQLRLCADGGANRLFDEYKPDVIKGDMDSIRTEVLDFYANLGTKTIDESHDQDTTDLHKCVSHIPLGGRFDHEIGNINVLCRFRTVRLVLLSEDCLIQLLPSTHHHEIYVQSSTEGPHCGLIPIGMPSGSTTTTGLQWDLTDTEMRFGGLISTSNIVKDEKVTVRSDSDLLWTISIKKTEMHLTEAVKILAAVAVYGDI
ncbi:hypothetical protein RJ640_019896 [Escallonia rubra]|uniref:Thiamine pyrophosphokinase n=1 Tax=Escallonia rubra TaxID=112253 RepID=A0AA88UQI0_9ASTE|nr:hypothetical protein RJ640_019896 [Escallonia rubra]